LLERIGIVLSFLNVVVQKVQYFGHAVECPLMLEIGKEITDGGDLEKPD